ncbi:MAG: hypothetical protein AAGK02_12650 [Pseudomonadota bacterium]
MKHNPLPWLWGFWSTLSLASLIVASPLLAQGQSDTTSKREINITSGSTPGWIPSQQLEDDALETLEDYLSFLEVEDYLSAYQLLGSGLQASWSFEQFKQDGVRESQSRGALLSRERIKVTWTNGGPTVPAPGTYVAIDASERYERVDRHCGYTVLFKGPESDRFVIVRREDNLLANSAADTIAEQNSQIQMELVWRVIARNCPNYAPPPLPASISDGIEFGSVAEARAAIEDQSGTETRIENGWTIIFDEANYTAWSFSPEGARTHPSVIKRSMIPNADGTSKLAMSMKCEVEKSLCDALFEEMALLNGFVPISFEPAPN